MGKHLLNLKARTKGKLEDGKPIGGRGRLTETKIKKLQKYYGLAIRQNTIKKSNPTDREVDVSIYTMKKNIIAILNHSVKTQDPAKQHRFCPLEKPHGVSGSRMSQQRQKLTKMMTVCLRYF